MENGGDVEEIKLTEEQKQEFIEAFNVFDQAGKGYINSSDLAVVMKATGQNPTDDEIKLMISEVDVDGNGQIELDEFLAMIAKRMKETSGGDVLDDAFHAFDHDHNEVLTPDEIRRIMLTVGEKLTDEEVESLVKGAGCSDGRLTYEKFILLITGKPPANKHH